MLGRRFKRGRGWSLMLFCARATRGRGLPSLDARSGRSISPHPRRDNEEVLRDGKGWPGALLARGTRAIGMCSFDARSKGQPRLLPLVDGGADEESRLLISCARATRGLRRPSLDARSRSSISPHSLRDNEQAWREHYRNMVAQCAQLEIHRSSLLGPSRVTAPAYFCTSMKGKDKQRSQCFHSCHSLS